MSTIYRVVGDHGELARIRVLRLFNADGEPITSGDVRLRAEGLFEREMTSAGDGDWYVDLDEGDLARAGRYQLELLVEGSQVTLPARRPWALVVRSPAG